MRSEKKEQDGWSRMTLLFKLELILYVFCVCCVYGGSDSIPLVPLPFPALGPRLVGTVYCQGYLFPLLWLRKSYLTITPILTWTEGKPELGKIVKLMIENATSLLAG